MRRKKILLAVILSIFVFSVAFSLQAEDKDKTFYGNFMFGYRTVDTSGPGADFKYKEDINLDDGVRLFNFSLHFVPKEKLKKFFDRIDINVYNFGGDPFETFGLSIQKYGTYKFQYDRKKAVYFYHDLHEAGGDIYDLHTFNFDRIMDSGFLNICLGSHVDLYLNFDRYTKKGESVTTFDINRIEFEFDKPISEESNEVAVGVDVKLKRYSFVFEEKIQDYENSNSLFQPGYADGGASARYPSSLNYFYLNQPYDLKTYTTTFKFNARPFNNLLIAGSAQISNQNMDITYSEDEYGIDYLGNTFMYTFRGEGNFKRQIQLYDFDISYLLLNKLAIIGAFRYHDFEQDGSLTVDGVKESAILNFDTFDFEGGLQYQFSPKFALTLGYRFESRDLEGTETVTHEDETLRSGFFGNLKWDFRRALKLTLDFQRSYYDGPYTLISPTIFDRFRVTAKLRVKQFNFSGSYLLKKSESEIGADLWKSTKNQLNLRLGYNTENVRIFTGYSLIDVEHKGDRTVAYPPSWSGPGGTFLWSILYEGESHLFDGSFSLKLGKNWKIGSYANSYSNKGFWEISRTTLKEYLEYTFESGLITQLAYRYVDFKEKSSGFNDYKANILELSFGYRWE